MERQFKAAGIVSYGGVSAGTRAANSLKADLSTFKMRHVESDHSVDQRAEND
jgi:NAD(P)H-dependent FMN reductase